MAAFASNDYNGISKDGYQNWGCTLWHWGIQDTIPSSFVDFRANAEPQSTEFVHSPIPLFDLALKGVESGYQQCFRSLPADLSQHHTLCDTYEFLFVDVLSRQSISKIFNDLKSGQCDTKIELIGSSVQPQLFLLTLKSRLPNHRDYSSTRSRAGCG